MAQSISCRPKERRQTDPVLSSCGSRVPREPVMRLARIGDCADQPAERQPPESLWWPSDQDLWKESPFPGPEAIIPQLTAEEVSQALMLSCSDYWGPEHQGHEEIRLEWESLRVLPPRPVHRALHWATGGVAGVLMVKHLDRTTPLGEWRPSRRSAAVETTAGNLGSPLAKLHGDPEG